jgi:hypothetical protein
MDTRERDALGEFLIARLQGATSEGGLKLTRAVTEALIQHLSAMLYTLEQSGRVPPEEMKKLREDASAAALGKHYPV